MGTILHPAATFKQLGASKRGYWWLIFAATALTVVVVTLAASSVQSRALSSFSGRAPGGNFGAATGSNGAAPRNGGANAAGGSGARSGNFGAGTGATGTVTAPSPLLLIGLPLAGGLVVTVLDYVVRALLVFLMSMLLGGKVAFKQIFPVAAWTTLPAAIRRIVEAIAVFATGGQVAAGFSAALTAAEVRSLPLVNLLLGYVDMYTVWSLLLLGIGAAIAGKLSKGKAAATVGVYIGVSIVGILVFYAVSSAVTSALGGAGGGRFTRPGG
jgi:Yip1 domain